jgi:hypothetical protein
MGAALPDQEDALRTERNSAVAEAKMWLRRALAMQNERDQAKSNLHEAEKCLGEWQAAYDELLRAFRRLEVAYEHERVVSDTANFLIDCLQPLAMDQLARLIDEAPA